MSMGKQGEKTAVPRLRFPEFRGAPRWSTKVLGDEGEFLSTLTGKSANDFGKGKAKYVTYMNVFSNTFTDMGTLGIVDVRSDESQNAIQRGDVLFTVSSETPEEVGMSSVVIEAAPNCYVNSFCAMFRFSEGHQPNLHFLGYSLRQPFARRHFVQRAQGSTRFNLSKPAFRSLPLALPLPSEQQKIADCLTPLDEVIAAQGRKVEALKAHKRGLMQQLFPREGETRPRLRFPEFRDAPEWDERPASSLISTVTPPRKIPTSGYQSDGGLAIVDQSPDAVCGWTDDLSAKVKASLPLLVFGDHTCVLKLIEHDFAQGADGIKIISAKPCVDIRFLFFALQADPLVSTSYRRHFSLLQEKRVAFSRDSAEQQRIAACLSSLDNQITAESNQLAALKTHKQGLMQQLFPAPDATTA